MKKPADIYSPKSFFGFTSFAQFFQGIRPKRVNVPHAAAFSLSAGLHNGSIPPCTLDCPAARAETVESVPENLTRRNADGLCPPQGSAEHL
jgi:hypothetical protein